jgi:hypothetical protein
MTAERKQSIGKFEPKWTLTERRLVRNYIKTLHDSANPPARAANLQFVHSYFAQLFDHEYSALEKVASVMEQAMLISCLAPTGEWKSAKVTMSCCAAVIRTARSMTTNASFMGSLTAPYKSIHQDEAEVEDNDEDPSLSDMIIDMEVEDLVNDLGLDEETPPLPIIHHDQQTPPDPTLDAIYEYVIYSICYEMQALINL